MSTRPSWSAVAVCHRRAVLIEPVALNVPLDGSNSSASAVGAPDVPDGSGVAPSAGATAVCPPANSTFPSESSVAVERTRGMSVSPPAGPNVPLAGCRSRVVATTWARGRRPGLLRRRRAATLDEHPAVRQERGGVETPAAGPCSRSACRCPSSGRTDPPTRARWRQRSNPSTETPVPRLLAPPAMSTLPSRSSVAERRRVASAAWAGS